MENTLSYNSKLLNSLSATEKIFLGALLIDRISLKDFSISSISKSKLPLSPGNLQTVEILHVLQKKGLINPFEISNEEILNTKWNINFNNIEIEFKTIYKNLLKPDLQIFKDIELLILWKSICVNECLENIINTSQKLFNIKLTPNYEDEIIIENLLDDYSTSEIFYMIYNSSNYILRESIDKKWDNDFASKQLIIRLYKYSEKAKYEKWTIRKSFRPNDLKQSSLSKFLFENVLHFGELGFNEKPNLNTIKSIIELSKIL
ncbi:MAG: hypothetical protein RLZZ175_1511 [Bacteroidota bacterium]|jgi:hypothetical protein